jgi:diguanylate cyclase (GGDEF)-like protein
LSNKAFTDIDLREDHPARIGGLMIDFKLEDEPARLAAMRRYGLDVSGRQPAFEKVVALVQAVLGVPICAVMLIGNDQATIPAALGMSATSLLCNVAIQQRRPLLIEDARRDYRFSKVSCVRGDPGVVAYVGVPLATSDGYNVGALCAIDTVPRRFTSDEVEILTAFADLICEAMELRTIAHRDYLTGALTRRAFAEEVNAQIKRGRGGTARVALAALDLDHFKSINDRLGHAAGDSVLRSTAARVQSLLRQSDCFGRVGGEEFAIILPEASAAEAGRLVERLRAGLQSLEFPDYPGLTVTASFGIAMFDPRADSFEAWLAIADAALYEAKNQGRNRCVSLSEKMLQSA